ncbi:hypothetical protein Ade02nite_21970 [Paractinoplanes deccanensis]|uniref:Uncharacterized protein n=1 Tax=Paractinoplanes deccanensis TaxID=113561 RepID=A0ABQ3Y0P0_9ACTN|nr:hypothetical protein [Actinoplanes deccanensis]GID73556.1 hypothetical protein Ade02nite_21970 [Actinoplanes deccanensis]
MRMSVPAALAALVLGPPVLFVPVLADASAARAAAIFLEVNPSTVPAGDEVGLRASCDDNLKAATVTSGLFGTVTVAPQYGFLTATVRVPSGTRPGDYRADLRCPDGRTTSATVHVVAKVEPARGPATGGGGTAPGRNAPLLIGGGLAVFAAGLILGVLSLRRRRLG